jgi:hypothetical protein
VANATNWKNRIVGEGVQAASQFIANPANWRVHPQAQRDAMRGVLNEIGWVQRVIVNRRTGYLVDGHERVWQALQNGDAEVPFVEVDLDEAEEAYVLATLDPIGAMAQANKEQLGALLDEVQSSEAGVQAMLAEVEAKTGLIPPNDPMAEWQGMPEFEQDDIFGAVATIKVHFAAYEDMADFAKLVGQNINAKTKFIWYPKQEPYDLTRYQVQDDES